MRPEDRDPGLLWDIARHARELQSYMQGLTRAEYLASRQCQLVAERLLSIIGEAANRLSPAAQANYSDVPWRAIVAQRHVLVHDYGRINQELLWTVISEHIPTLLAQLGEIEPPPPSPSPWERER